MEKKNVSRQLNIFTDAKGLKTPKHYSDSFNRKFIEDTVCLEEEDAKLAGTLGFTTKLLVQTALPHSDPKTNEIVIKNGNYTLTMLAPSAIGLPFGSKPRVLLTWITTQATKTKSRCIYLGESLARFLNKIGYCNSGGKKGDITAVKTQMYKLLQTYITCSYRDQYKETITNLQAISRADSWWIPLQDVRNVWQTELVLNEDFYQNLIETPIPINLDAIYTLKHSSLALDYYCWLTYRMFSLRESTIVPWGRLFAQFGGGYSNTASGRYAFKKHSIEQLRKIKLVYPAAQIEVLEKGLYLKPSPPHIAPKDSFIVL